MHHPLNILIIGRSKDALSPVVAQLENQRALSISTHVLGNGNPNPLHDSQRPGPDALVLALGRGWRDSLLDLVQSIPLPRPPFVVVSPESDIDLLRAAMRVGTRDVFAVPFNPDDFISAIIRIEEDERLRSGLPSAQVIAFMNTKGGSGASFLAVNVAMVLAGLQDSRTLLMDLEFQFGALPTYLDLPAKTGLIKAFELIDGLDESALQGYTQVHNSGLHLLAAAMDDIVLPEDIGETRVKKLLSVLDGIYRYVVIDLPRRIDGSTASVLMQANKILLVTQQSISHLHNTKRLVHVLHQELGIPTERLMLLVNRFDKKGAVRLEDFAAVTTGLTTEAIPNDHVRVAESIDVGVPMCRSAPGSPLGKRLIGLANTIGSGWTEEVPKGGRLLGWLNRSLRQ
jgi:pilus assembly protein CpaE